MHYLKGIAVLKFRIAEFSTGHDVPVQFYGYTVRIQFHRCDEIAQCTSVE